MGFTDFIKLLRPQQWYKNLVIFLALIFSANLFIPDKFYLTIIGLIVLCLVSSSNYIFNDIIDRKRDRFHPEKKHRPIASGKVKPWQASIIAIILLLVSVFIAFKLGKMFLCAVIFIFVFTQIYSLWMKKEPFLDILAISVNFVVRAVSGALIIDVEISPWLILCVGLLSLFLSSAKRKADLEVLGKKAAQHKNVLKYYTKDITNALLIITTTLLVISYALFSFLSNHKYLLITLPFALYVIFRYLQLVYSGSVIARHPEKSIYDVRLIIGVVAWLFMAVIIMVL